MDKTSKSLSLLDEMLAMENAVPDVEFLSSDGENDMFGEAGIRSLMRKQGMLSSLDSGLEWLDKAMNRKKQ